MDPRPGDGPLAHRAQARVHCRAHAGKLRTPWSPRALSCATRVTGGRRRSLCARTVQEACSWLEQNQDEGSSSSTWTCSTPTSRGTRRSTTSTVRPRLRRRADHLPLLRHWRDFLTQGEMPHPRPLPGRSQHGRPLVRRAARQAGCAGPDRGHGRHLFQRPRLPLRRTRYDRQVAPAGRNGSGVPYEASGSTTRSGACP